MALVQRKEASRKVWDMRLRLKHLIRNKITERKSMGTLAVNILNNMHQTTKKIVVLKKALQLFKSIYTNIGNLSRIPSFHQMP